MQYARGRRLGRFKSMLRDSANVAEALYDAGYGSSSRAYETAGEQLGMTPASYRKGGSGAVIRYVVTGSALGEMLVAGTASGVCAVKLGDDAEALMAELRDEFPAADIRRVESNDQDRESGELRSWASVILASLDGGRLDIDLPPGRARHRLPVASLAEIAGYSRRRNTHLPAVGRGFRATHGEPRRGPGLRRQPGGARRPLPPRSAEGWQPRRLSLGAPAQGKPDRDRMAGNALALSQSWEVRGRNDEV